VSLVSVRPCRFPHSFGVESNVGQVRMCDNKSVV
jgi:hypothetical protein